MTKENDFGAFRLKKETVQYLRVMKQAFELSYCKDFTNDEFIKQMAASVEDGDVGVWEIFCELDATMDRLEAKGRERRG